MGHASGGSNKLLLVESSCTHTHNCEVNLSENITLENFLSNFLRVTKGYKFTMRPIFAVVPLLLASFAAAAPFPQLSEAEFRSLRDESTPNNRVSISNGYANVRRQGRMLSGEMIDITRPVPPEDSQGWTSGPSSTSRTCSESRLPS